MDKRDITKEIKYLENLGILADSYARISSARMKKIRGTVLLSRQFLNEIHAVFKELQDSYRNEFVSLARKKGIKKGQKITFINHNGKGVAVFISTNAAFYGGLSKQIFNSFMKSIREHNYEVTIVGSLGVSMFREVAPGMPYSYFDFPDYGVDRNKMSDLIKHLVQYEEIHLFYGKFKSIVNQVPEESVISAESPIEEQSQNVEVTKYIFEPSLEEILMFFETEMFSSVFEQVISESQLAKLASRMIAMDLAGEKIRKNLEFARHERLRVSHYLVNKRQLESLPGVYKIGGFL